MDANFTAKEKVIVHILDYYGKEDGYSLPVEITQEGIADCVGLKQNTVSYAVRKLVEDDLMREETRRIKGKKQKRKAYFLTDSGIKKAKDIKEKMLETEVEVSYDGNNREMKIGEINTYFQTNISLLEIIQRVEEEGTFEFEGERGSEQTDSYLEEMPEPEDLEIPGLEDLLDNWDEIDQPISVVGPEGSGKTTFLTKLTEKMKSQCNVFYFEIKDWQEPMHLWDKISEYFEMCGQHRLSSYLKSTPKLDKKGLITNLQKDLKEIRALLIFDDVHSNEKISSLVEEIVDLDVDSFASVVSSTSEYDLFSPSESYIIELGNEDHFLDLLKRSYDGEEDIDSLESVLDNYITEEEFWALALLSILREPVKKKELTRLETVTPKMVENILNTPLMSRTVGSKVITPNLVRKELPRYLIEEDRRRLHEIASEYYMEKPIVKASQKLEELYHLLEACKYDLFEKKMVEYGEDIVSSGYYESMIGLIDIFQEEKGTEDHSINFVESEAYRKIDDHEKAIEGYRDIIENSDDEILKIRSHLGIAETRKAQDNYGETVTEYQKAIEEADEIEEVSDRKKYKGKAFFRLGSLLNERGKRVEAEENLYEALNTLGEDDHSLLTTAYFMLARIKKLNGDWDESVSFFQKGLDHWKQIKETYQKVGGLQEIGALYTILRELKNAEEYLKEAVDTSEKFGYWDLKSSALLSLTECYLEKNKLEKAIETAERAKELLDDLDDEKEKAFAYTLLGKAYSMADKSDKAEEQFTKAISIYQRIGSSYRLGLAYFSMAKLQEKKDNKQGVAKNYRKAILSFSGSGASWMAERVEKEMENIPISM